MRRRFLVTSMVLGSAVACGGSYSSVGGGGPDGGASTADDAGGGTVASEGGSSSSGGDASSGGTGGDGAPASCASPDTSTAGVQCSYAYDAFNSSASVNAQSTVTWSCSATTRSMTANGIPDHDVGTFPNANCPNTIAAWSPTASVTLTPTDTGTATPVGIVGFALNGVKFDPSTAGTCTVSGSSTTCSLIGNTGTWNIEALGQSSFNFGVDDNNAHVQPTGEYHYHGMPTAVLAKLGQGAQKPTLVGFALDGFPVYARYGYTDPTDSSSAVKAMTGSYQLKATPDSGRPSTATYPMGAFTQDYEYVAGSGDLDECNGRTDVTPEFPCGIYHYYITDTYPFIQRCEKGTPTSPGGGGGGTMPTGDGGTGSAKSCTSPSDCTGACPPGSKGCTCNASPMGDICVPTCTTSSDCPTTTMGQLTCQMGVCVP